MPLVKPLLEEVDIGLLEPNNYNPNAMDPDKFDLLADDVLDQGMDQPVVVIPHPEKEGRYMIVDGEHRYRASLAAGKDTILISKKEWDLKNAKLQTVRRNILRGEMDKSKFSALVRSVEKDHDVPVNDIRKQMGFVSEKEFERFFKEEQAQQEVAVAKLMGEVEDKGKDVSMVSELVRQIILKYGDNLSAGMICFSHKGSMILALDLDKHQSTVLSDIDVLVKDLGLSKARFAKQVHSSLVSLRDGLTSSL